MTRPPGPAPRLVLAIDGGNSKTDVMLLDPSGDVLGRTRGPGASPQNLGMARSAEILTTLVDETVSLAGIDPTPPFATHTAACLAGADLPVEEQQLRDTIAGQGWSLSTVVENDTFALLRMGTHDGLGVALVCGAGINCVGRAADGRQHRFLALGESSGDWGGGQDLGNAALFHTIRAEDGRGQPTGLRGALLDHLGVPTIASIVEAIHLGELPGDIVYEFTPLIFAQAEAGDTVAVGLVDRLVDEIGLMVSVAAERLELTADPMPLVLGGGVLTGVGAPLVDAVERRCREAIPKVDVRLIDLPPIVGAALLGLDAVGAPPSAETRLRASYPGG